MMFLLILLITWASLMVFAIVKDIYEQNIYKKKLKQKRNERKNKAA